MGQLSFWQCAFEGCLLLARLHLSQPQILVVLQRAAVVGRKTQAGTRTGNQPRQTHRLQTSAHQCRPTTPHKPQTQHVSTSYKRHPPTRALHMHQTRTPRTHHATARWHQKRRKARPRPRSKQEPPPQVHTERMSRRRGNPPAPTSTPPPQPQIFWDVSQFQCTVKTPQRLLVASIDRGRSTASIDGQSRSSEYNYSELFYLFTRSLRRQVSAIAHP